MCVSGGFVYVSVCERFINVSGQWRSFGQWCCGRGQETSRNCRLTTFRRTEKFHNKVEICSQSAHTHTYTYSIYIYGRNIYINLNDERTDCTRAQKHKQSLKVKGNLSCSAWAALSNKSWSKAPMLTKKHTILTSFVTQAELQKTTGVKLYVGSMQSTNYTFTFKALFHKNDFCKHL